MIQTITLDILRVQQPIGEILVAKIKPSKLLSMSVVDRRRIENNDQVLGIQRELKKDKVIQIKNYLQSIDASFPNSIIVNTTSNFIIKETKDTIQLEQNENTFTIIDGQHRLEGFRDNKKNDFELILTIFKDLKTDQQANIFSTINSQQTKVDPSLNLNLELNSKVYTPKKMMIEIAESFNYDKNSPWFKNIKLLGSKTEGIISLSAFVTPLLEATYNEKDYYLIRNELIKNSDNPNLNQFQYKTEKYIFWELYKTKDFNSIYKILFNFFNALKDILSEDWVNDLSLLNKTTGYSAIMKLFKDISEKGFEKSDLSYGYFYSILQPLNEFNGKINSQNYGASGLKASNELYIKMKNILSLN